MSTYVLPHCNNVLNEDFFDLTIKERNVDKKNNYVEHVLCEKLNNIKSLIDNNVGKWDLYKRITNQYEYIHTNISSSNTSVSKLKPLSRSFYKMIEIMKTFRILEHYKPRPINTFHLAEGPGGFLEAVVYKRKNPADKYYAMTLIHENDNVPGWKKSKHFLKKHNNVYIENGKDNTGNLYNHENFHYCAKKYRNSIDLITGDGGFDYSLNYDDQEEISLKLIYAQIIFAFAMQKKGGVFILKVFDMFTNPSFELIYFLMHAYNKVIIIKPKTSRSANSEKYIVCIDFKYKNTSKWDKKLGDILFKMNKVDHNKETIMSLFSISMPIYYVNCIKELNASLVQKQITNIMLTLKYIHGEREDKSNNISKMRKNNINNCIQWCITHEIPNNHIKNLIPNIFTNQKYNQKYN